MLPTDPIAIDTDLLRLGIRSIHLVKVATHLRDTVGIDIAIGRLFECRTPGEMAEVIRTGDPGSVLR
ncbi:hypothetical protein GCM10022225_07800 [Plantactinospora mayteni]